jgi:hypothetical protein
MIQNSDAKWTYHSPRGKKGTFYSPLQNMVITPAAVVLLLPAVVLHSRKLRHTKQAEAPGGTTGYGSGSTGPQRRAAAKQPQRYYQ